MCCMTAACLRRYNSSSQRVQCVILDSYPNQTSLHARHLEFLKEIHESRCAWPYRPQHCSRDLPPRQGGQRERGKGHFAPSYSGPTDKHQHPAQQLRLPLAGFYVYTLLPAALGNFAFASSLSAAKPANSIYASQGLFCSM